MDIGNIIKKYRREKDLTQEQLAEYLNVSVSAVSQWESGKTTPDIAMLVSIANLFNITTDELLGRNTAKEKDIEEYRKKNSLLANEGRIMEKLALWREAVQKYPGDYECLCQLGGALSSTRHITCDSESKENNAKEACIIFERILRDCKENSIRNDALVHLVYLYSDNNLSFADEEKAVSLTELLPCIWNSKEILLEHAYYSNSSLGKKLHRRHSNILGMLDHICMNIYYEQYDDPNDKIMACNTALKLWETVVDDGNYLFYHCRLESIYKILSRCYAELKKTDETINALEKAFYHAKKFYSLPRGEQNYTAKTVRFAIEDTSCNTKNYTDTNVEMVYKWLKRKDFDFIRENPRFIALTN